MPIRRELRYLYGPRFRRTVRYRALTESCNVCSRCGMPGPGWYEGDYVVCASGGRWYDEVLQVWRDRDGRATGEPELGDIYEIRAQLTTAHLDHDPRNNTPENTRALCRACHLRHDARHHAGAAHETRAAKKDAARPILQVGG